MSAVAGSARAGYALRADGSVWAWGSNGNGQLGNGTATDSSVPVPVSGLGQVTAIAAGGAHAYALLANGTVRAWGYNGYGQLGNGTLTDSSTPVQVSGLTGVVAIAAGSYAGYAVRADGTVWAWGDNEYGQLGTGDSWTRDVPVQVNGMTGVTTAIASEASTAYALSADGTVRSWGYNRHGELGNGTTTDSHLPVAVSGLTGATAVAAGGFAGYAVLSDGTVRSWGWNGDGQLGNGTQSDSSVPVAVTGMTGVASLAAGNIFAQVVRSDGTVWAWGYNFSQFFGAWGTPTPAPVQLGALAGVRSVAAGFSAGFAIIGAVSPVGGAVTARENPGGGNYCAACAAAKSRGTAGDPIDTATGSFSESFVDLTVSGRGPQLAWTRSYSSALALDDGPLGFGWSTGYGARLTIDSATGNATVAQENGAEVAFTLAGSAFSAPPRVQATLVKNPDGTYTFVRQTSQTLTFTATGALTSIADRNGETTTLTYTGGDLATVTEPGGRTLTVTYTGPHITKVTDPLGHAVSYTYDAGGNLASTTGPDGAVTTFGYDDAHHVTSVLDPTQHAAATTHPLTMVYDAQGRVTSQIDTLGRVTTFAYAGDTFSSTGGITLTTDPAGRRRSDVYYYGVRASTVTGYGSASAATTVFTFDPVTLGVTSTSVSMPNDPVVHVSTATYNQQGKPLTQVDGLGREIDTTYNAFGEPLTVTSANPSTTGPARVTTTNTYDAMGNLLSVSRPLYSSATDHAEQVTTYERADTAHPQDITAVTDPLGNTTVNTYTATGDLASSTSPQGRKTTYTYDAIGRRLTSVVPKGNVSGASAAQFTTTYTYDPTGRVLSTSTATAGAPIVTSSTYDADGRVLTTTDGLGRVTTNTYDLAGELVRVTRPDGSTRSSTYWPDGALKTQVDGDQNTTSYAEDTLGRVASVTDALGRATTYTHDATGAVLTVTDPQNQVTTNAYDAAGELVSTAYSDAKTPSVTRTYNNGGLVSSMVDGTGTTTFTYDSLGRLTTQAAPAGTVKYAYNLRGQVTTLTYPNNKTVTRVYEADGALTSSTDWSSKKTTFTYDQNEAWTGGTDAGGVATTIGYDNPGRVTTISYATGTTTLGTLAYTNDAASQITQETSNSLGASRTFTLDTTGRLTGENTTTYGYDNADQLTTNGASTQAYDAAGQLTSSTTGATTTSYTFDARGNRTGATTGAAASAYAYDQANHLTGYTKGTTTATYTYNGDGLRATKTVGTTTTSFVYDTAEGLPLILFDGASYYQYGPGGIPYAQTTTGGVTTYLHPDQSGSIRLITSATGTSVGTATYTAYGTRTTTGTTSCFGYTGQYTDTETGLQWLHARYYDPTTAQFLTLDPLTSATGTRYTYTGGNPITGADPTGLDYNWGQFWGAVALTGAIAGTVACVLIEPCGLAELAVVGGGTMLTASISATAIAAGAAGAAAGGVGDLMMQRAAAGTTGSDCPDPGADDLIPGTEYSRDEIAQLAYQHAGEGDLLGRPSLEEISAALSRGDPATIEGQNALKYEYRGVRVIVNRDIPWRSTAYYPGS